MPLYVTVTSVEYRLVSQKLEVPRYVRLSDKVILLLAVCTSISIPFSLTINASFFFYAIADIKANFTIIALRFVAFHLPLEFI